jgi:hypothetical protein
MASKFTIEIALEVIGHAHKTLPQEKIELAYCFKPKKSKSYGDTVTFKNDYITIVGKRTIINQSDDLITSPNSTYYLDVVRSLLYFYITTCSKFKIKSITLTTNDRVKKELKHYNGNEINQYFSEKKFNVSDDEQNIIKKVLIKGMTSPDYSTSKFFTKCLMHLVLANIDQFKSFEQTWQFFDGVLGRCYSKFNEESKQTEVAKEINLLNTLRQKIVEAEETEGGYFQKSLTLAKAVNENDLKKLHIEAYLWNIDKLHRPDKIKKQINSFFDISEQERSFKDTRILNVLLSSCPKKLFTDSDLKKMKSYTDNFKKTNQSDILRFIVLKYSYYLRNNYFHGAKMPMFLLKNERLDDLNYVERFVSLLGLEILESEKDKFAIS